jgi:hypothetical protein
MENTLEVTTADEQKAIELGILLGQQKAFGMVAGRCSAAQAECLRKTKEEKLYLKLAPSWDEYCERYLKMSRRNADRFIFYLKKYGVLYFDVVAMTGITPGAYGRIEKSVREDGVHIGGEIIALIPANTERVIDAVARLQAEADAREAAGETPVQKQLSDLTRRGHQLAKAFRKVARSANDVERSVLHGCVEAVTRDLGRILGEYTVG